MNKKLKFKLNRKKCIVITIAAFLILCGLFGTYTYVRAGNFIYRHTSDELNMTVNSVTYYYNDSRWNKPKNKTYTISSNWVDSLAIKHDVLGLGTNTTVYGPYTWLPAGQYKVQYDFTKNGGDVFKYWDVVTNFGANGTEQIPRTSTDVVDIPGSGAYVESPYYWTDGNGKGHLSYIINTTGDAADYELRLFFSDNLGYELPEGSDYNSQKGNQTLYAFLENLSIESVNDNVITFDAQGGTVNGNATGTLLTTNWGKQRGNAPVPTRSGYVFDGWYGYSSASNMTDSRENLTFDTGSSEVKIWNTDGTPAIGTEVSYYGYEVHAKWIQVDQFVSYLGNGADNKEDYYISYNAAVTNQYNALDFKKTGYSGSRNWIQKDQFMNTTGTVSGSGRESMPQLSGLTSIRTKCGGRYKCVDINAASSDNGANAQIWDCVNGNAQMYAFVFVGFEDGEPYWVIRNNYSGKVLDAAVGTGIDGGNNGANIQQWTYHGGDNQKWTLQMAGDGYFYIRSKLDTNLVLDLLYGSTDNGTNIQLCSFHGGDNQRWYLWDNTINLSAEWTSTNYKVDYNADGGTLLDENGNETTDTVRTYEYDRIYNFLKAKRAYTVSYETNGGTAAINSSNTDAPGTFNGWNEQLDSNTTHGEVHGWDGWSVGTWNWAAYYNGNPDLLRATNNTYDTMWAILHYREHGIDEGRTFNGASYWLPALSFKNLTANGGTVNVKADYTNGTVTLPKTEKASVEIDGKNVSYTFDGWYLDPALTNRVGGAGDTYTPAGNTTLYAKYTTQSENLIFNQKIRVRYENADGTWTSYTTIFDKDFRTGDTVDYDFGSLDTDKWVRPAAVKYTVSGQYQTEGYTTSVDIYRQTYNVTITYDNADAFSAKSGEGTYRWGQLVDVSATVAQKTAENTYEWNGFAPDYNIQLRNNCTLQSNPMYFVMPQSDVEITACSKTIKNKHAITIEHYLMDTDGTYPAKADTTVTQQGNYGETLKFSDLANKYEGFTYDSTVTVKNNGNASSVTVTDDITIKLYYSRNKYDVTIEHYLSNESGVYPNTPTDSEKNKMYYDEKLSINDVLGDYTGYTADMEMINRINSAYTGVIEGDTVIKLYYSRNMYRIKYVKGLTNNSFNVSDTTHVYDLESNLADIGDNKGTSYTINFDSNKGNGTTNPDSRKAITGTLPFSSWEINGKNYANKANVKNLTNENNVTLTATAQWSPFNTGELEGITRNGYEFDGWYTAATGGEQKTSVGVEPSDTAFNLTLYAHWTAKNYTITFNYAHDNTNPKGNLNYDAEAEAATKLIKNGSDGKNVIYDSPVGELPAPELTGANFVNWVDENGVIYTKDTIYTVTDDITLYAVWTPMTGVLTYDSNGVTYNNNGIGELNKTVTAGEKDVMTDDVTLEKNVFGKTNDTDETLINHTLSGKNATFDYAEIPAGTNYAYIHTTQDKDVYYSFQGWSADPMSSLIADGNAKLIHDAGLTERYFKLMYETNAYQKIKDTNAYHVLGDALEDRKTSAAAIKSESERLYDEKSFTDTETDTTMYAVWDEYPQIVYTRSRTLRMLSNKFDEYLEGEWKDTYNEAAYDALRDFLNTYVKVYDREDGTITPTYDEMFFKDVFNAFIYIKKTPGATTREIGFRVFATDSSGNKSAGFVKINITNSNSPDDIPEITYGRPASLQRGKRFINRHFYELGDPQSPNYKSDYDAWTYRDYGGLTPKSVWYTLKNYRDELLDAFDNLDNDTPEEIWYVPYAVKTSMQERFDELTMPVARQAVKIREFYELYKDCITYSEYQ